MIGATEQGETMTDSPHVLSETRGAVRILRLNRPDSLNALSGPMLAALKAAIEEAANAGGGIRCLVLTGEGRGFSSGADLVEGAQGGPQALDLETLLKERYNPLVTALHELPMPVIAAVNGPAAGAGMSLALAADFIIAARSAYFLQAFVRIGLVPDAGSTYYLPRLIGPARAARMMMLGERVNADEAAEWGLVHRVVDDAALMDTCLALASELARGPTRALAAIRRLVRASFDNDLAAQLAMEAREQGALGQSKDFLAGVGAFLGKSEPRFSGE